MDCISKFADGCSAENDYKKIEKTVDRLKKAATRRMINCVPQRIEPRVLKNRDRHVISLYFSPSLAAAPPEAERVLPERAFLELAVSGASAALALRLHA